MFRKPPTPRCSGRFLALTALSVPPIYARHTVQQAAAKAVAALQLPAGPVRTAAEVDAAAELCTMPCTMSSWDDAFEVELMEVGRL